MNESANDESGEPKNFFRKIIQLLISKLSDAERAALLEWVQELIRIREMNIAKWSKIQLSVEATIKKKIIWPIIRSIASEIKCNAWDNRRIASRFLIAGASLGLAIFGTQGAGIAALGTAIGVPLWIVVGGGSAFAGVLIEELINSLRRGS